MSLPLDPKDAVERLIELCTTLKEIGFSPDLSPANISRMALLDVDALESDGHKRGFFSGLDLNAALEAVAYDKAIEGRLADFLRDLIKGDHAAVIWSKSIEKILQEEFEPSSDGVEKEWQKANMLQKAEIIAKQRARKDLVYLTRPDDYRHNVKKYEFKVCLQMLYGGNGRQHGATLLAFSYNTPFHSFLRTLEDRTQLCVIPPITPSSAVPFVKKSSSRDPTVTLEVTSPESVATIEAAQTDTEQGDQHLSSSSASSRTASTPMANQTSSTDFSKFNNIDSMTVSRKAKVPKSYSVLKVSYPEENSNVSSCKSRGYTLEHGPWSYRVVDLKNPPSSRIWKRLAATDDYIEMLETIKRRTAAGPNELMAAIIMHSLDVEAYEESEAQKFKESFEGGEDDIPLGWDKTLDNVDDDGEGEPYLQWLSRRSRPHLE